MVKEEKAHTKTAPVYAVKNLFGRSQYQNKKALFTDSTLPKVLATMFKVARITAQLS